MAATYEELNRRIEQWYAKRKLHEELHTRDEKQLQEVAQELEDIRASILLLQYVAQETNRSNEEQTATLVTLGLQETFDDQELSLIVEHENYRGHPGVSFKLKDEVKGIEDDPMEAFGGGPQALIGLLLQVISIIRQPNMARILILDEPLAQISAEYQEATGKLLRKLCEPPPKGLNFKMLVITHMERVAEAAHKRYTALPTEDGMGVTLVLNEQNQTTTQEP